MNYAAQPRIPEVTDTDLVGIKTAMRDISQTWDTVTLEKTVAPGTEAAFDAMAADFKDQVALHPATTERFRRSTTLESGYGVLGRYFYAGALTGALHGFTVDQMRTMFFTPTTYRTVEHLTREVNSSAKEIEFENGIRLINYSTVDDDPSRYKIADDGGLVLRDYPLQRFRARMRLAEEGRMDYEDVSKKPEEIPTNCKLNRLGTFAVFYKTMADITLKDPQLVPAVLSRPDVISMLTVE